MNELNPSTMLDWLMAAISGSLNDRDLQPQLKMQIRKFLKDNNWDELHWLLTLIALEVEFKIFVPEQVGKNIDQNFTELITSLILEPRVLDPSWVLKRLFILRDIWFSSGKEEEMLIKGIKSQ